MAGKEEKLKDDRQRDDKAKDDKAFSRLDKEINPKKEDLREAYAHTYEEKALVIKIMPRTLERIIFALVILLLIFVLVFQKGCSFDFKVPLSWGEKVDNQSSQQMKQQQKTGNEDQQATPSEPDAAEPDAADTLEDTGEETSDVVTTPEPTVENASSAITDGLSFDYSVDFESKKVNSITFTIVNGNTFIIPRVRVFWYDAESIDKRKTFERGVVTYTFGLTEGQKWTKTITEAELTSKFFEPTDATKETVELKLFDMKTNTQIMSLKKDITTT